MRGRDVSDPLGEDSYTIRREGTMEKMNKWKSIGVVKAVRVVMVFQGAVALGVVLAVATPELLNRGAEPLAQHQTPKDLINGQAR